MCVCVCVCVWLTLNQWRLTVSPPFLISPGMCLVFHNVLHSEGCVARPSVPPCSVLCIKTLIIWYIVCVFFCVTHLYYSQCALVSLVEVGSHFLQYHLAPFFTAASMYSLWNHSPHELPSQYTIAFPLSGHLQ